MCLFLGVVVRRNFRFIYSIDKKVLFLFMKCGDLWRLEGIFLIYFFGKGW